MSAVPPNRVKSLEQVFAHIADTRMRDIPVQNPALRVQAVGFAPQTHVNGASLLGVLVTPWFMNLVWLPMDQGACGGDVPGIGQKVTHRIGGASFDFIGAHEDGLGAFACCSLFSPMFEFEDQAVAVATASEVMNLIRMPERKPIAATATPSRRGFLFGRGAPRSEATA